VPSVAFDALTGDAQPVRFRGVDAAANNRKGLCGRRDTNADLWYRRAATRAD
jgi:hypothetical protein